MLGFKQFQAFLYNSTIISFNYKNDILIYYETRAG